MCDDTHKTGVDRLMAPSRAVRQIDVRLERPGDSERAGRIQQRLSEAIHRSGEPRGVIFTYYTRWEDADPTTQHWIVFSQRALDEFIALGGES